MVVMVMQESLRRYSVVPVVVRELGRDDVLCGYKLPRGSHVVTALKAVHQQWKDPMRWQPERFLPGGEFDQFSEDIRQYMVCCLGTWLFDQRQLLTSHLCAGKVSDSSLFTPTS